MSNIIGKAVLRVAGHAGELAQTLEEARDWHLEHEHPRMARFYAGLTYGTVGLAANLFFLAVVLGETP